MQLPQKLIEALLLGENQSPEVSLLPIPLQDFWVRLNPQSPSQQTWQLAAATFAAYRADYGPQPLEEEVHRCCSMESEDLPYLSVTSCNLLMNFSSAHCSTILYYFAYPLIAQNRKLVLPAYHTQLILEANQLLSQRNRILNLLTRITGKHGIWLMGMLGVEAPKTDFSLFFEASPSQRLLLLEAQLKIDRSQAFSALQQIWPKLKAVERQELLQAYGLPYTALEISFWEEVTSTDRSEKVQHIARDFLLRLSDNSVQKQTRLFLHKVLQFDVSHHSWHCAVADEEPVLLLLTKMPLAFWNSFFQADSAEVVTLLQNYPPFSIPLLQAKAAYFQRDAHWAMLLLQQHPISKFWTYEELLLFSLLSPAQKELFSLSHSKSADCKIPSEWFLSLSERWGPVFSGGVLGFLLRNHCMSMLEQYSQQLAIVLHLSVLPGLKQVALSLDPANRSSYRLSVACSNLALLLEQTLNFQNSLRS